MKMKKLMLVLVMCVFVVGSWAQTTTVEGFAYTDNNQGFLNEVVVVVYQGTTRVGDAISDKEGKFVLELPSETDYRLTANKQSFKEKVLDFSTKGKKAGEKLYLKVPLARAPGYLFEATVAEALGKKSKGPSNAIEGYQLEIFNNTKERMLADIAANPQHTFNVRLEKGNHYTMLLRKDGYFPKRIEARVDIDGCILCFEGIGNVNPGVTDNLSEENTVGVLGANISLKKIEIGEGIRINNIYYDYNSARIRDDAEAELDNLVKLLKAAPSLNIELNSHTDSRGDRKYNMELSQRRAQSVVDYLITNNINPARLAAMGMGESKLLNKCGNNVECTEDQHQVNRRTNFKVTSISTDVQRVSLSNMLMDERMDEMMAEMGSSNGIIQVPADGKLPDAIQKEIEAQAKGGKSKKPASRIPAGVGTTEKGEKILEVMEEMPPIEVINKRERPLPVIEEETPEIIEHEVVEEMPEPVREEIEQEVVLPKPEKIIEAPKPVREPDPVLMPEPVIEVEVEEMPEMPEAAEKASEMVKISKKTGGDLVSPVASNFNGYKIVIHEAKEHVGSDHAIFSEFGSITTMQDEKGMHLYMIGSFTNHLLAENFMQNVIKESYAGARVLLFMDGKVQK